MAHPVPAQRPWRTAILAGMASYLDSAALVGSGIGISVLYAGPLGLTPGMIGTVLACQQFAFALGALFGGRLGDRFGRRRVLTLALIVFAVGAVLLATAVAPWMLIPGAVLTGLGIGADLPVALALANEAAPPRRKGRMVSLSALLWALGIATVQLVVSFVGHLGVTGARIIFWGLVGIAVLVLLLRISLPESQEWLDARRAADRDGRTGAPAVQFRNIGQIFRRPVVFAVLATGIFYAAWNVGASINGQYKTYIWTTLAGGDVETISRLALIALVLSLLASALFMALVDTRWRRPLTVIGTVLILVSWAPLTFLGPSRASILVLVFLFGLASSLAGEPLYKVWSQELIPTLLRGTAQGVTMAFARVVAAILAFVVPSLLASSPRVVFTGIFVCAVVSTVVLLVWMPRLRTADEYAPEAAAVAGETAAASSAR
ncbi:MFS transporter [Streptomyces sp. KM273126]|uniref:MFS transporter n=1 Tax=Streptomyces sp. KM273126 TaxID=2545247 RepID=UPI001404ACC3|nr:MFS transporter [Streptomyces sp. KM273126]MBA2810562.1 MFS transporter [Streptomyces sp. KM273126]